MTDSHPDIKDGFFKKPTFLTPSAQLQLEAAACGLKQVYTMNPTFRAENSSTCHHLAEFTMLEVEVSFEEDISYFLNLVEDMLKNTLAKTFKLCFEEIQFLFESYHQIPLLKIATLLERPFYRISYSEAVDLLVQLSQDQFKTKFLEWGQDLSSEHEQYISACHFAGPVFIYEYPTTIKPFYMKEKSFIYKGIERKVACNFDLIFPQFGEICGGSLREESLNALQSRIKNLGNQKGDILDHENMHTLDWYLDLRKYGSVPHGGFGIGFDRLLQFVTGFSNIRDVVFMARTAGSISY